MKFGINTFLFTSPFTNDSVSLFPLFKKWGFDSVEIALEDVTHIDPEFIKNALDKNGLTCGSICAAMGPGRDLRGTIEEQATALKYLKEVIDIMPVLGCPMLAGPLYSSVGRAEPVSEGDYKTQWDTVRGHLKDLAAYATQKGVKLAIEPLNRYETDFINTAEQGLRMVAEVNSDTLLLHLDTFHMNIEEKDPAAAILSAGNKLGHFHACGSDRGTPGNDHTNWDKISEALQHIRYDQQVVIESFTTDVKIIAKAASIWRKLEPSQEDIAIKGLAFLKANYHNLMSKKIWGLTTFLGLSLVIVIGCKFRKMQQQNKPAETVTVTEKEDSKDDDSQYSGPLFNDNIRSTTARTPEEERLAFKLPPGFEIQLYAAEPDIGKPINIAFDAKGRMWVTQSFEYPFPAQSPNKGKDRLTILEDTDHDGKADKFTHFNDTLNIPIGILPLNDGAIAYSIPSVTKFTDVNGDDIADKEKTLLTGFGHKDTHGMVNNFARGYDGWVYADHGFTNQSTTSGSDGHAITMTSGNTFRFRIDGSRVEQTTYGRVNPFGLAYDEKGYLYSTDCHSSPLYQLIRGGDYPSFGKTTKMGYAPDMKRLENEATALAGLVYYDDVQFPEQYRREFYMGDVVTSRIYRDSYINKGSSPIGKREADFMKSKDPWFRPVDVKLGPDGALYVADFYNSIIGHYEVPLDDPHRDKTRGRIWRITYKGQHNPIKDWTTANINELLAGLDMQNISVRMTVTDQLSDRIGTKAISPLKSLLNKKSTSSLKYIHSIWVLQRLNALTDGIIKKSAGSEDPLIRLHTMRILLEQKPNDQNYALILKASKDKDPHVQRAAIEDLANYPSMTSLEAILAIRPDLPAYDTHLVYTARLCIKNLLLHDDLMKQIIAKDWNQQDATNIADVLPAVPSAGSAIFLDRYINKYAIPGNLDAAYEQIAEYIPAGQLDKVITDARARKTDVESEFTIFGSIQQGIARRGAKATPALQRWGIQIAEDLLDKYPANKKVKAPGLEKQKFAINIAGDYKVQALSVKLQQFLEPGSAADIDTKTDALRALLRIDPEHNAEVAAKLFEDSTSPLEFKIKVANALGDLTGSTGASVSKILTNVNHVLASVKNAPPDLQSAIVTSLSSSPEGKDLVLSRVRQGQIFSRVLIEPKVGERMLLNISPKQKKEYDELTANVEPVNDERNKAISLMIGYYNSALRDKSLPTLADGHMVFIQNCSPCHKIGTEGGNIGPNLDGVSKWGPNALATKIIDPNRNISEAFRNYTVKLKDGKVLAGLYRRDEGAIMIFADASGKEFGISKNDIAERTASKFTLMPDNFRNKLSKTEFNAIINYLLNHN